MEVYICMAILAALGIIIIVCTCIGCSIKNKNNRELMYTRAITDKSPENRARVICAILYKEKMEKAIAKITEKCEKEYEKILKEEEAIGKDSLYVKINTALQEAIDNPDGAISVEKETPKLFDSEDE